MLNIIFIFILLVCLAFIAVTLIKKFPVLANINIAELKAEQQADVKTQLLEKRFKRKFKFVADFLNSRVWKKISTSVKKVFDQIVNLEKKYKQERKSKKIAKYTQPERQDKIKDKINTADELFKQEDYSQAEKAYIQAIALDAKAITAYLGLAKLYFKQKDFTAARETYQHILKIDKSSDNAFSGLGNLALEQGNLQQAKENYNKSIELGKKNSEHYIDLATVEYKLGFPGRALTAIRRASELEPNSPKYLDFLTDAAITNKNKILALDTFNKLKQINPDNQKLDEFKKRIGEM